MRRLLALALLVAACGTVSVTDEDDVLAVEAGGDDTTEALKADGTAGNVELKVTVRADQNALAQRVFKLTDQGATWRTVYFYDTRKLDLFQKGLILRARKVKDGADDSTVKLRPMQARDVAKSWFSVSGFKCEEDRTGTTSVQSCSLTTKQDTGEIDDVAKARRAVDKLFGSDQERFVETYATVPVPWSQLSVLGPIDAKVWSLKLKGFALGLNAERWRLPDGTELLELSTRVPASQADRTAAQLDAYLAGKGLDTSTHQETKTRVALDYFSHR